MIVVNWAKLANGSYCPLQDVDLSNVAEALGVYVIWKTGLYPVTVRVGQGFIGNRLNDHRNNPDVMRHNASGLLVCSWARPQAAYLDGIERYLAERLRPLVGERFPDVAPIAVNLPQ